MQFGTMAFNKLIKDYEFKTVIDIGFGHGEQSMAFIERGKKVTSVDYGQCPRYGNSGKAEIGNVINADFNKYTFRNQFDCVWCCHVLEHQLNTHLFLCKINEVLKEGGILALTVPPAKHQIVSGHVSLWNGGLLIYNLVLAGFDCKKVSLLQYGYNISIILKKRSINIMNKIVFGAGDIKTICQYLPAGINYQSDNQDASFNGNVERINW